MIALKPNALIYFIGIGGTGMSAAALLARSREFRVAGADHGVYPPTSTLLEKSAISFFTTYDAAHLNPLPDLVVVGGGERAEHNPEIQRAKELGIPMAHFPELVRFFWRDRRRIVVAGTHGKTTTTSLLAWIMDRGGLRPGFFIGGYAPNFQSSVRDATGRWAVLEGDEYASGSMDSTSKFLRYEPDLAIITSVEWDHPDQFHSLEEVKLAFRTMIKKLPRSGLLVANADDPNVLDVARDASAQIQWVSLQTRMVDWSEQDLRASLRGMDGILLRGGRIAMRFHSQLHGEMNIRNLLCAVAMADYIGVPMRAIADAIFSFQAPARRSECIGEKNGVTVLDDFAHHPTAVRETLRATRLRFPNRRIWVVFEPHTYSRTQALLSDYRGVFDAADEVLIADIAAAREACSAFTVTSHALAETIRQSHVSVQDTPTRDDARALLLSRCVPRCCHHYGRDRFKTCTGNSDGLP